MTSMQQLTIRNKHVHVWDKRFLHRLDSILTFFVHWLERMWDCRCHLSPCANRFCNDHTEHRNDLHSCICQAFRDLIRLMKISCMKSTSSGFDNRVPVTHVRTKKIEREFSCHHNFQLRAKNLGALAFCEKQPTQNQD